MGVDAKDVKILVFRFLKSSFITCSRFVRKYPIPSGIFILSFLLYLFVPSFFFFLMYSSPFVFCTAVFVRFYFLYKHPPKARNPLNDDEKKESRVFESHTTMVTLNRNGKSAMSKIESTSTKGKNDELSVQEADKKKEASLSASPSDRIFQEEDPGESSSSKVSINENGGEALNPDVMSIDEKHPGGGCEAESESSDDKEAQEVRNKAVEWNEDDQKNVMDLGISELERNRRLESLIARRRARKSMKLTGDKNPLLDQIGHVLVARNNPFLLTDNSLDDQLPGSAPSVLLPYPNPFDLPYDSSEEKPNLMADSFHQEFAAGQQKDTLFCKHESFSLRTSFGLDGMQDSVDGPGCSRFKRQLGIGTHDGFISYQDNEPVSRTISITDLVAEEQSPSQVTSKPEGDGEVINRIEAGLGKEIDIQADVSAVGHHSFSSDDNENTKEISQDHQGTAFRFSTQNSLPCPLPRARSVSHEYLSDTSPSVFDKTTSPDQFFYGQKGPWHTPSNSIASDMQVEVSEVGSPPLDGTASSSDGESLTYDADIEKEVNSGSDEMWGASPHAPRVEYRERELSGLSKGMMAGEISGIDQKETVDPFTSAIESLSYLETEMPQEDQSPSPNSDVKEQISPERTQSMEESLAHASMLSESSGEVNINDNVDNSLKSSHHTDEQSIEDHTEQEVIGTEIPTAQEFAGAEEAIVQDQEVVGHLSEPVECSQQELSKSIESTGLGSDVNPEMEDLKSNKDRVGETESCVKSEQGLESEKSAVESMPGSSNSNATQTVLSPITPLEETKHFNSTEDSEGDFGKQTNLTNISAPVELGDSLASVYDREEQQSALEVTGANQISSDQATSATQPQMLVEQEVTGANRISSDQATSATQPQMLVEQEVTGANQIFSDEATSAAQLAANLSTSSSPKSVLTDRIATEERLSEQMQADASECEMEDGQSHQAIVLAASQDEHRII